MFLLPIAAAGQDDQLSEPDDGSPVRYEASWFERYEPVNALDMLDRIPGIDSILASGDSDERGLGAGGSPILIEGKRVAGKANSAEDMLERMSASQVARFEIVRGGSADLDVRTSGPVVNVILEEGASRSTLSAELRADFHENGYFTPGGGLALNGMRGGLTYLISYQAEPQYEDQRREEYSVDGDNAPYGYVLQLREREQVDHSVTGNFGYQVDARNLFQLNTLFSDTSQPQQIGRDRVDYQADPTDRSFEQEDRDSERRKWEFGGTYEHRLPEGDRYNLIFVVNEETDSWAYARERRELTGDAETVLFMAEDQRTRERILRGSYKGNLSAGQDIEVGVETAQTILDKTFLLGSPGEIELPRFGGLAPASDISSRVQEMRYEPFMMHNWQLGGSASLESTLVVEFSEIEQEGVENGARVSKTREFQFLKPKLDYRHELSPGLQLRVTLEREVSQLSFSNFTATSSGDNDLDRNVVAGNPGLEPEKSWRYELDLEYRTPDNNGVFSSRFFYYDIQDVIDRVDVSAGPGQIMSAPGNIGDGEHYGAELDASFGLENLGLSDALLTAGALIQDSEAEDPFLEERRPLNALSHGEVSIGLRHDIPDWKVNYGADYTYHLDGDTRVDIQHYTTMQEGPEASLYLEKNVLQGVTFRLEGSNLVDSGNCYEAFRYSGRIEDGSVREQEEYCYTYGREMALMIETTF